MKTSGLRILLICLQDSGGPPLRIPAYRFWRTYFAAAFQEAGHELLEVPAANWASGIANDDPATLAQWRKEIWDKTIAWIKIENARQPIDLFLSYLYPSQIETAAIDSIKALGAPCVNFFCDNVREFRRVPPEFKSFDLNWVPEFEALPMYRTARLPYLNAPMPCWIPPARRSGDFWESSDISFIGRRDHLRAELFADAIRLGFKPALYGPGWCPTSAPSAPRSSPRPRLQNLWNALQKHGPRAPLSKLIDLAFPFRNQDFDFSNFAQPAVDDEAYWAITQTAEICVGVNRFPSPRHPARTIKSYSRLRDIEAPMAGACYLTEWTSGIDQIYDIGTEIETYRTAEELVEKSQQLQRDASRRKAMRAAGQARALNDHSIKNTIHRIAQVLNLR